MRTRRIRRARRRLHLAYDVDNAFVVGGDMGKYSAPTTYKLSEIDGIAIVMPEESKWPERAVFYFFLPLPLAAALRRLRYRRGLACFR